MKVAIYHNILWSRYKGAVFSEIPALAKERGIDVRFVQIAETESDRAVLNPVDLSYHRYPYRLLFKGSIDRISTTRKAIALVRDLFRDRPDLALLPGYDKPEYWAMLLACIVLRIRRAVFCDSTLADRPRRGVKEYAKRLFFRCCDGFFCYGVRSSEYLARYGVPESRIFIRCQAAALPPNYSKDAVLQAARKRQSARGAGAAWLPRFLFVGRLSQEKGLSDLLHALRLLTGGRQDADLQIAGAGPLREELGDLAKRLELSGRVTFLGPRSPNELIILYRQADALVLPSRSEPWGLVVNEALSYGCPVVVSDACGCVPELVVPGKTGFVFKAGDPSSLHDALIRVLEIQKDYAATAQSCLEVVGTFTPGQAAIHLTEGCRALAVS